MCSVHCARIHRPTSRFETISFSPFPNSHLWFCFFFFFILIANENTAKNLDRIYCTHMNAIACPPLCWTESTSHQMNEKKKCETWVLPPPPPPSLLLAASCCWFLVDLELRLWVWNRCYAWLYEGTRRLYPIPQYPSSYMRVCDDST